MEMMQPSLRIGRNIWDRVNMPETEFRTRITRVRREMRRRGIELLLVYGNGFNEYADPCYLTNYVIRLPRGTLVCVPLTEEPTLFFEGSSRGLPFAKSTTWVEDVKACGDVSAEFVKYLNEKKLIPKKVGQVGLTRLMPHAQLAFLSEALGDIPVSDLDGFLKTMRKLKSVRERDQVRRAGRVVKRVFEDLAQRVLRGMNERLLESDIYREARLEGSEDVRILMGSPDQPDWSLAPAGEDLIQDGERVIIHLQICFERYWAQGTRTFIARERRLTEQKDENLETLLGRVANKMIPGISTGDLHRLLIAEIERGGMKCLPDYGIGGGIGLAHDEIPRIAEGESEFLMEGMCLSLNVAVRTARGSTVMLGNTGVMGAEGLEWVSL